MPVPLAALPANPRERTATVALTCLAVGFARLEAGI